MKFITFYACHDASIAGFDGEKVYYFKLERFLGKKHINFFTQNEIVDYIKTVCDRWNFFPDAIAYTDGNKKNIGQCEKGNLWQQIKPIDKIDVPTFCIDHHYAHALSCWPVCDLSKINFAVVVDGEGDHGVTHKVISNPANLFNANTIYETERFGFCKMLTKIGIDVFKFKLQNYGLDFAGKIMGAQSYGRPNLELIPFDQCHVDLIDLENFWNCNLPEAKVGNAEFDNWLATLHEIGMNTVLNIFKNFCPVGSNVVFSGGCAQSSVLNDKLYKIYGDENFHVAPHSYDGGLSLGCLEFLRNYYKSDNFKTINFPYWQDDIERGMPSDKTIDRVADMLNNGKIVGWFQGRGEVGPRALGNRSILMSPAILNGKDILNQRIKKREYWRPYAPSVLESECSKWFDCERSPHMLRAVQVKKEKEKLIPSVVHVDGSSRIQTVTEKSNLFFHKLIKSFFKKSNIPMLLNTSLNIGGQPIFSTEKQCLDMIENTDIDAICIGNRIHAKIKIL